MVQCRTSDPSVKCFIRSTSNPGNVGHGWVKDRFIDKLPHDGTPRYFIRKDDQDIEVPKGTKGALSRSFLFSTLEDNPSITENDPTYIPKLDQLPAKLRQALRFGDWDAYDGQYFSEWKRHIHVTDKFDFSTPHLNIIGLDYGFTKPSSVGWYAVLPSGNIVRYRELYKEGYTYEALIKEIIRYSNGEKIEYMVADPAIWGDKSHHKESTGSDDIDIKGKSGAETMQDIVKGLFPIIRADNSRVIGWGRVREYLKPFKDQHGQINAKFKVLSNCYNFIRTIPGLIHDKIKVEDLDTDGEDHAADECRYVLMSRPLAPKVEVYTTHAEDFWKRVKKDLGSNSEDSMRSLDMSDARTI
jgi:hypothetical protein